MVRHDLINVKFVDQCPIGQRSQEEDVAEVVGTTSSGVFSSDNVFRSRAKLTPAYIGPSRE